MIVPFFAGALLPLAGSLVASAALTALALRYARWRRLVDLPGQRRSHSVPTPRGGGIAIVLALLLAMTLIDWPQPRTPLALGSALLAVALVGWIDDHRPLSARARITVHALAALALVWLALPLTVGGDPVLTLLFAALAVFWLTGCINAWNFMDGSNGLLASQCLWLGLALAWVFAGVQGEGAALARPLAGVSLALAGACAGFLPFNAPRAAIFLGDVGSGALGFFCGALLLAALVLAPERAACLLILPSALLVDAGLTLAWRVYAGRRWYTAHREHLYQWLVRSGHSHASVATIYLAWNLFVVLPACAAAQRWPEAAPTIAAAALLLAAALWWQGKSMLRRRARIKGLTR
jgi:UDP-N-acetylmuramyl pentapeptide phosphotransferase/UDP-N-acetylglucosamine-1-phosphate transferase